MVYHYSYRPLLLPTDTTTATSAVSGDADHPNRSAYLRLVFVISLCIISAWANFEASRSFSITVINEANELQIGKLFNLLYISNDKATRIIQNASSLVESILHTDDINNGNRQPTRKQLLHITLRLGSNNLANSVMVNASTDDEFVISVSLKESAIDGYAKLQGHKLDHQVIPMVLEGVARVWLWDSKSRAPPWLLDGMVEYIKGLAGFGPAVEFSGDKDPLVVAKLLEECQQINKGFIRGLNEALIGSDGWDYFEMEPTTPCDSYFNKSHGFEVGRK